MYFLLVALSKGTKHTQTEMNENTLPPPLPKGDENQQDQEDTMLSTDNRTNGDTIDNEEDINLHVDLPPLIPFESNEQQERTNITDNEELTFEFVIDHHTPTPIQIGNPQEDELSIPVLTITLGTFQRNQNQHYQQHRHPNVHMPNMPNTPNTPHDRRIE